MRQFKWRFDFQNQWIAWWRYLHHIDENFVLLAIHFKKNRELGAYSLGMTILNFRFGFEKDVPARSCHQHSRRTILGKLILE